VIFLGIIDKVFEQSDKTDDDMHILLTSKHTPLMSQIPLLGDLDSGVWMMGSAWTRELNLVGFGVDEGVELGVEHVKVHLGPQLISVIENNPNKNLIVSMSIKQEFM
jgi:hypothetical protein